MISIVWPSIWRSFAASRIEYLDMASVRDSGGSIFIVEDDAMIRMMLVDMVEELGYSVAAEAGDLDEAMDLARSAEFDLAILDVNVNGKVISPVAELLETRNRRFLFATGYGLDGLPDKYRDRPSLQKPFQMDALAAILSTMMRDPS